MRTSQVALMVKNLAKAETYAVQEDPLEEGIATHSRGCLENSMDRGFWWATVHGVAWSQTRLKQFGTSTYLHEPETLLSSSLNAHSALEININGISQDRKSKLRPARFLTPVPSAGIQATPPQFLGE